MRVVSAARRIVQAEPFRRRAGRGSVGAMRRAAFVLAAAACGSSPPPPELAGAPTPAPPPGSGAAATAADALPTRDAPLRWRPLAPDRPFHAVRVVGSGTSPVRCALSRDGEVACWGRLDPTGSTPSAARAGVATPVVAEGIRGAIDLALASSGDAVCVAQRVGPGGCIPLAARPARAPFPKPIAQVVERDLNVCARYRDGTAGCLTYEGHVPLAGLTGATELACTHRTCCALTPAGARCVGPAFEGGGPAATAGAWPIVPPVPADAVELRVRDGELCVRT